jgi:hypothetical protein
MGHVAACRNELILIAQFTNGGVLGAPRDGRDRAGRCAYYDIRRTVEVRNESAAEVAARSGN